MKKHTWLRMGLAAAALTAILTVSAGAASVGTGTVNASALNLRSAASTDSATLGLVYGGSRVDILEDTGDGWYQVSYNGKVGYMSAEYVTMDGAEAQSTDSGLGNGKVDLTTGTLNLRSAPSTDASRLAAVPAGTVMALEAKTEEGWYQVTYLGITGYVSGEYVVPTTEAVTPASASSAGEKVVALAKQYLGCPYVYGATGPNGFDCSGFTYYIFKQMGYTLNRTSTAQYTGNGYAVDRANLQAGDLVFFRSPGCSKATSHVGIYIGNSQFIHASSTSGSAYVKVSSLNESWYGSIFVGGRRVLG